MQNAVSSVIDSRHDRTRRLNQSTTAARYAPIVAADPPDGLIIDTSGADHLHGGEEAMQRSLVSRMEGSGMAARAAVADAWGTAHAAARFLARPLAVIPAGQAEAAMRDLPIGALRLPTEIVEGLHVLGFERIGDIEGTPKAPLTHRFGPELVRRLDQAMGRAAKPFEPVRSPELVEIRRAFGEPIGAAETIARYTARLVDQLCAALEKKGLGARRLDLLFHRVDNHIEAIRVGTAAPVRDARRLTRLLTDRIETIDPGFGIELMTLTATLADPAMGIVGALVIARWSWDLIRDAGGVLLDYVPSDEDLPEEIRAAIEVEGDEVVDLHVWQLGPGHRGAIVSLVSDNPKAPSLYRAKLAHIHDLSHVTVEVEAKAA